MTMGAYLAQRYVLGEFHNKTCHKLENHTHSARSLQKHHETATMGKHTTTTLSDYHYTLANSSTYCLLWIAELVKQSGNWFTYVAAYSLLPSLLPQNSDPGFLIGLFLLCRRIPYLVWFPAAGFVADNVNRGAVLITCGVLEALVSFSLPFITSYDQIW